MNVIGRSSYQETVPGEVSQCIKTERRRNGAIFQDFQEESQRAFGPPADGSPGGSDEFLERVAKPAACACHGTLPRGKKYARGNRTYETRNRALVYPPKITKTTKKSKNFHSIAEFRLRVQNPPATDSGMAIELKRFLGRRLRRMLLNTRFERLRRHWCRDGKGGRSGSRLWGPDVPGRICCRCFPRPPSGERTDCARKWSGRLPA